MNFYLKRNLPISALIVKLLNNGSNWHNQGVLQALPTEINKKMIKSKRPTLYWYWKSLIQQPTKKRKEKTMIKFALLLHLQAKLYFQ